MARVLVPLAEGFEDVEAVTIVDVLRRGGVEVVTASIHDSTAVRSAHGIVMTADSLLQDVKEDVFDAVVLPGGGKGTENLMESKVLFDLLRQHNNGGRLLAAICAAPTVLIAAGVVEPGLHVTCYPTCQMALDRHWTPAPVVADGNVITGQAPGSALLFSLIVLQTLLGDSVSNRVARGMVTDVLD